MPQSAKDKRRASRFKKRAAKAHFRQQQGQPLEKQLKGKAKKAQVKERIAVRFSD